MYVGGGVDGGGGGDAADDGSDDDGRHPLNQTTGTTNKRAPPVGGREWCERARRVAEREWEFDAQGGDELGHDLFLLSFFQVCYKLRYFALVGLETQLRRRGVGGAWNKPRTKFRSVGRSARLGVRRGEQRVARRGERGEPPASPASPARRAR